MKNKIAMLTLVAAAFMSTTLFGYDAGAFTNDVNAGRYNSIPALWLAKNSTAAAYADNVFAQADVSIITAPVDKALKKFFPKTSRRFYEMISSEFPYYSSVELGLMEKPKETSEKYIKYTVEDIMFHIRYYGSINYGCVVNIQKAGVFVVRRWLRKNGKSFVVKETKDDNGNVVKVNPVKEHMDELTAILNAPKFNGLVEWLEAKGVAQENIPVIPADFPVSDDKFEEYKRQVLDGEIDFSSFMSVIFRWKLGTDGYNDFIKLYNDGVAE